MPGNCSINPLLSYTCTISTAQRSFVAPLMCAYDNEYHICSLHTCTLSQNSRAFKYCINTHVDRIDSNNGHYYVRKDAKAEVRGYSSGLRAGLPIVRFGVQTPARTEIY